jgi:hypothetical protein
MRRRLCRRRGGAPVRILCLATLGRSRTDDLCNLWHVMAELEYGLVHAAGEAIGWRMVFERVIPAAR